MGITPERSTPRCMFSILTTLGLVVGVLTITASSAGATACRATDGNASSSNLQTIIDGALTGDTITVKGTCIGNFSFGGAGYASLTLLGKGSPKATLDGNHSGSVVTVSTSITVTLKNLLITNGNTAFTGGGISNSGTVKLTGNTQVNGNTAKFNGGGIANFGDVNLNGTAQVNGNYAGLDGYQGGGIYNVGTVKLRANAQVNGNSASGLGGGIYNIGTLRLIGQSQVNGNLAGADRGGGIANNNGTVGVTAAATWTGTVSGNSPDNCDPDFLVPGCL